VAGCLSSAVGGQIRLVCMMAVGALEGGFTTVYAFSSLFIFDFVISASLCCCWMDGNKIVRNMFLDSWYMNVDECILGFG
jgi:hypothetical protein